MRHGLFMFRHNKRLTQEQAAAKIGVTRETYRAVENGYRKPSTRFREAFVSAFGVTLDEFERLMQDEAK